MGELSRIAPKMVSQYLVGLGDSAVKRNLALSLNGFFDRLVNRHVCGINSATSVKSAKETVVDGATPQIGIEQARTLVASIDCGDFVGLRDGDACRRRSQRRGALVACRPRRAISSPSPHDRPYVGGAIQGISGAGRRSLDRVLRYVKQFHAGRTGDASRRLGMVELAEVLSR